MNTGTKIFLAVFALFVGVLVLYYGVLTPGEAATPAPELAIIDPATSGDKSSQPKDLPSRPTPGSSSAALPTAPQEFSNPLYRTEPVATADASGDNDLSTSDVPEVEMGASALPPALDPTRMLPLANVGTAVLSSNAGQPDAPAAKPDAQPTPTGPAPAATSGTNPLQEDVKPKAPPVRTIVERSVGPVKPNVGASIPAQDGTATKKPTPPQTTEYVVKSGDTMVTIAKAWFGDETKWSLIAKANPWVDPARMQIGQKLQLPAKDAKAAPVREQVATDKSVYIVRSGDSLAKIAREFYNNVAMWEKIYEANRATIGDDPAALQVGMKLALPPRSN